MSLIKRLREGEAPPWLIAVAAALVLAGVVYFGRQALAGQTDDAGPPKKVYPGMYDLRAEAAKMRAANGQQGTIDGSSR